MKRISTQKVKPIPGCGTDSCVAENLKSTSPEVNRRVGTSAAMIGLAISMGASSLLLPRQSESAMAAEPTDSSLMPTVPAPAIEVTSAPAPEAIAVTATAETSAVPLNFASRVQTEHRFSPTLQTHQFAETVLGQSVAEQSFSPTPSAELPRPSLKANAQGYPLSDTPDGTLSASAPLGEGDRIAAQSESNGAVLNQLNQSIAPQASSPASSQGDEMLKAKHTVALSQLKESSNRLRNSLAEWKSEESDKVSAQETEPTGLTNVTSSLENAASSAVEVQPKATTKVATSHQAMPQLPASSPVVEATPGSLVYKVKLGDTLGEIAHNYGLSPAVLARTNELTNPNQLKVNQMLAIPQTESVSTLRAANESQPNRKVEETAAAQPVQTSVSLRLETKVAVAATSPIPVLPALSSDLNADRDLGPYVSRQAWETNQNQGATSDLGTNTTGANRYNGQLATVPNQPSSLTKQVTPTQGKPSTEVVASGTEEPQFVPRSRRASEHRHKEYYNPYVERLREEISQLRSQYRNQQGGDRYNSVAPVRSVGTANNSASLPNSSLTPSEPINPEFDSNTYNRSLQAEIQKRASQRPTQPVESRRGVNSATTKPRTQPRLLATAPTNPDTYQPFNQSLPGRLVSPDLPPLNGPELYIPNGINQHINGYMWPSRGLLTSGYGWRWGRMHRGIDIAAPVGTPIVASAPGVVVYARWNSGGYGNLVDIRHPDGSLTRYGHNSRILVQEGQVVEQGQQIALMGSTGRSTGPHCHFEIHPTGRGAVNPIAFLPRR